MGTQAMRIVIRVAAKDCAKAWGLLVRHAPGTALPDRTFVISEDAAKLLSDSGIEFTELSREAGAPTGEEVVTSARI
jgi:hypothetical protein